MATIKQIANKLAGGSYKPSAPAIKRGARELFTRGKVMSGFARVNGSAEAGDIVNSCWSVENMQRGHVGRDSETDTTGFKEGNREAHAATAESRRQEHERVDRLNGRDENEFGLDGIEESASEGIVDVAVESEEWAEQTQEPGLTNGRGRTKPTGLMAANAAYAARHRSQTN